MRRTNVVFKRQVVSLALAATLLGGCSGGNQILRVSTEPEDARVTINGVPGGTYIVDNKYDFPADSLYIKAKKPGFRSEELQVRRELDVFTALVWSVVPALITGTTLAAGRADTATISSAAFWGFFTVLPWVHSYKYKEIYGVELEQGSDKE